jgi:hypothetical protein
MLIPVHDDGLLRALHALQGRPEFVDVISMA